MEYINEIWFLQPNIQLIIYIIVSETVTIIMEKRYAENKNDYILTTIQLVVILIFLILMYSTAFFGLFK